VHPEYKEPPKVPDYLIRSLKYLYCSYRTVEQQRALMNPHFDKPMPEPQYNWRGEGERMEIHVCGGPYDGETFWWPFNDADLTFHLGTEVMYKGESYIIERDCVPILYWPE